MKGFEAMDGGTQGTVLIGGSTASGKSTLALALAEITGGVVLNADSVQLYRDLAILTARPGPADLARAEHRLYGILDAHEPASVAAWQSRVARELSSIEEAGRVAIVTGGTGLYFKALLEGLPVLPDIPTGLRAELRASPEDTPTLHARLARHDPALAARLAPGDRQRILRGLEVVLATGRPLTAWQADPRHRPRLPEPVVGQALLPPVELVDPRIAARLDAMLDAGLLDELRAFRAGPGQRTNPPTTAQLATTRLDTRPLAKADGVAEFSAYLDGEVTLEAAARATVTKVRRYAKRQRTFFKGQLASPMPPLADVVSARSAAPLAETLLARLEGRHRAGPPRRTAKAPHARLI